MGREQKTRRGLFKFVTPAPKYATKWQLQVSVNKCNTLSIGRIPFATEYHICESVLPSDKKCRDLGIMVAHDLSPSLHISEITAKAHQRTNRILRCFASNDVNLLARAFTVYVRPLVEYCSIVWSPCLKHDIEQLGKVQRRFTKKLHGLRSLPYKGRLCFLGLPSSELRRLQLDLIYCYKIVFRLVDVNFSDFFEFSRVTNTRGHAYKLYKSHRYHGTRSQFFAERIVLVWNSLPTSVNFASLSGFKRSLFRVSLTQFLKCTWFFIIICIAMTVLWCTSFKYATCIDP